MRGLYRRGLACGRNAGNGNALKFLGPAFGRASCSALHSRLVLEVYICIGGERCAESCRVAWATPDVRFSRKKRKGGAAREFPSYASLRSLKNTGLIREAFRVCFRGSLWVSRADAWGPMRLPDASLSVSLFTLCDATRALLVLVRTILTRGFDVCTCADL